MNLSNRAALAFALGLALAASVGCSGNNIALVGRDTLPARASQPVQSEIVGTVERVDTSSSLDFRVKGFANTSRKFGVIRVSGIAEPGGNHSTTEQAWFYRYSRRQSTVGCGRAWGV